MYNQQFALMLLFITSAPVYAEVYKCIDETRTSYSTQPCIKQLINLELDDVFVEPEISQQERFITPVYSGWKKGWKKTQEIKLERFSEIVYEPLDITEKNSHIDQQKLTNLPQSMSVRRFAISVEDIIESICVTAVVFQPQLTQPTERVFYGKYACSLRRDTQQGQLGYYKIMRGENSIYMLAIKWAVEPFDIEPGKPIAIIENNHQKKKMMIAEKYLQNEVKLCRAKSCF